MEYIDLNTFLHYSECEKIVSEDGFNLIELKITPSKGVTRIYAVISSKDPSVNISANDCSKIHRLLLEKLEELLKTDDTYMELSSPGLERNIRNAAEFKFFLQHSLKVWDKNSSDWIHGKLVSVDEDSLELEVSEKNLPVEKKKILFSDIAKAKFTTL